VRVAFISDVHANLTALQVVIEHIDRLGIERIYHAGDVLGYYPYPLETIRTFKERGIVSIRGNHDRAIIGSNAFGMNSMASAAIRWTMHHIGIEEREYLMSLHDSLDFDIGAVRCSMHHGSPFDEDEYVSEDRATEELLEVCGTRLLILGHTHTPFVRYTKKGMIVNPGSVGQPRDGDPRSSFIIYDSTKDLLENRRVEYDIASVEEGVRRCGLPLALAERLWLGY
jgi:putative phosphoesterase